MILCGDAGSCFFYLLSVVLVEHGKHSDRFCIILFCIANQILEAHRRVLVLQLEVAHRNMALFTLNFYIYGVKNFVNTRVTHFFVGRKKVHTLTRIIVLLSLYHHRPRAEHFFEIIRGPGVQRLFIEFF